MEPVPPSVEISPTKKNNADIFNIIHISLSFLLIFMAYGVSEIFQTSSDHAREGAIALAILYGSHSFSCLFLTSYLTRVFGVKLTLILSSLTYASFVGVNIYFNKYVLYCISFLLGIGSSLIWTAQGVYVLLSTKQHEIINQYELSSKRGYFNGLFFSFYQLNRTIGPIIASLLFYIHLKQWLIFLIMTIICICGSISLIFLRNVHTKHLEKQSIFSSIRLLKDPKLLFVVPLICYIGIEFAYLFGVFPPLIESKSLKFLVYATYGTTNAISSLLFGKLSDLSHKRIYFFFIAAIIHLLSYMLLISVWIPPIHQKQVYRFFIIVNCFGIGDGIFMPQIYSVLGTFFHAKRSFDIFANFKLFQTSFIAIGFLYKNYLNFQIQTYLCIGSLLIGMWILIICHYGFYSIHPNDICQTTKVQFNDNDKDKTIHLTAETE
jgi:hypothetical protein